MAGVPEVIDVPAAGLVLRRWRADDAAGLLAALERSLPELRRFMPWAIEEPSLETVGAYLAHSWEPPATFGFGLFDPAGEVVGGFGLHGRRGPGILEIGYWVRSDRTGRGYATAAAGALADAGLDAFRAAFRVEIRCDEANAASAAVAAKLGFQLAVAVDVEVHAAAQTGVQQVWAATRTTWRPSAGRPAPPAGRTPR